MTASFRAPEPGFEDIKKPCRRRTGRKDYRRNDLSIIAGAFTAADSEEKFLCDRPLGNSSRRISVVEGRVRACASGTGFAPTAPFRMTFASINIYWDMPLT